MTGHVLGEAAKGDAQAAADRMARPAELCQRDNRHGSSDDPPLSDFDVARWGGGDEVAAAPGTALSSGALILKRWKMTLKLAVTTAVAALVASTLPVAAIAQTGSGEQRTQTPSPAKSASDPAQPGEKRDKPVDEAVDALRETQNAIAAIDANKTGDALAAIERATGKLEIVLARTPTLAQATVDVSLTTHDVLATEADVEKLRGDAAAALAQGRLQVARRLISNLASETVVSISKLPLGTYPDALKQAAALLQQGKPQAAKAALEATLGTVVIDDVIIPLPLVRAQAALEEARLMLENRKRTDAESVRMRLLLDTARSQLRLGRALGYATEAEMSDLIASVDELQRKTAGSQFGKGLLDPIGPKFEAARRSSQSPK